LKAIRDHLAYPLALSTLCAVALWLRWANFTWMHIDERVFVERTLGFWGGDLNPHFFNYPTLQLYLASLTQYLYFVLFSDAQIEAFIAYAYFADDQAILAIARGLTTVMAVATVPAAAALGHRLYGASGGLVAGFLLCILPLHVRYSHLATTDAPATLWMTLALLFAVRIVQQGRVRDFVLAGICAGLAGASKYPTALICPAILAAALCSQSAWRWRGLALTILCAGFSFALTSPYVLLDFGAFWRDFSGMANEHLLNRNAFALSKTRPLAGLYALPSHLYYGAGLAFALALLAALAYRPRGWRRDELVVVVAFALFVLLLAFSSSTFMRYALPLAPLSAVLCARLFSELAQQKLAIALVGLAFLSAEPLYSSWQLHHALTGRDTRTEAAAFLAQHSPQGDMILVAPGGGGRAQLLSLDSVQGRKKAFLKSFSNKQLIRAYELLSQRDDLPTFYAHWSPQRLFDQVAPAGTAVADSTWLLWYEHPLSPHGPDADELQPLLAHASWRAEFSPGNMQAARFDGIDWYFVPIGGWHHTHATGPSIRLARVPLSQRRPAVPSARQFFAILYGLHGSEQAVEDLNWPQIIRYNTELLKRADHLRTITTANTLFRLCHDLARAWHNEGDLQRALHYWNQAIILEPQNVSAHYWAGRAHHDLGHYDEARAHYRRAQMTNSRYADLTQRLRSLDTRARIDAPAAQ